MLVMLNQLPVLIHEFNRVFRVFATITMGAKQLKIIFIIASSINKCDDMIDMVSFFN